MAVGFFISAGGVFYFERLVVPQIFTRGPNLAVLEEAHGDFRKYGAILDDLLAGRTWLVDETLSYADFRVATCLPFALAAQMPVEGFRNIARWHDRLMDLPAWREPFAGLNTPAAPPVLERAAG